MGIARNSWEPIPQSRHLLLHELGGGVSRLMEADGTQAMGHRILVVEDEAFIAFFLDTVLTEAGFEVIGPVDDAVMAMRVAAEERPDLALMDIRLRGELDGVTATRHLVEHLGVPVVVVSANASQAIDSLRPLTNHILGKPVASEELVATVREALAA